MEITSGNSMKLMLFLSPTTTIFYSIQSDHKIDWAQLKCRHLLLNWQLKLKRSMILTLKNVTYLFVFIRKIQSINFATVAAIIYQYIKNNKFGLHKRNVFCYDCFHCRHQYIQNKYWIEYNGYLWMNFKSLYIFYCFVSFNCLN